MERRPDRRVRRTRALLRQGLAQLMGEKSVNEVTVTELVERVDLNRSTFYLHYRDIPHMVECVEGELYDEIFHAMEATLTGPLEGGTQAFLADVFSILFANRDICAALLGPRGDIGFLHRIEEMLARYILTPLQRTRPDAAYRYTFCVAGGMGLIKDWLSRGCPESPQDMAERTAVLIAGVTHR